MKTLTLPDGTLTDKDGDELFWCPKCRQAMTLPVFLATGSKAKKLSDCPYCGGPRRRAKEGDVRT